MDELLSLFNTDDSAAEPSNNLGDSSSGSNVGSNIGSNVGSSAGNGNVERSGMSKNHVHDVHDVNDVHDEHGSNKNEDVNDEFSSFFNDDDDDNTGTNERKELHKEWNNNNSSSRNPYSTSKNGSHGDAIRNANSYSNANKNTSNTHNTINTNNNSNATDPDPLTNLRITHRHTSRASMLDAFAPLTYKSCSVLAASSKRDWMGYLVDRGGGKNYGGGSKTGNGLSGKTCLATCGIITSDTSSRLSAKTRRAFAMLSLGDLSSGGYGYSSLGGAGGVGGVGGLGSGSFGGGGGGVRPAITVFLFGDALRVLHAETKNYLRAGWVVAILGPSLMPPRDDNGGNSGTGGNGGNVGTSTHSTSVTLSINDPRQILLIGKSMDCDRCKGTTRKKVNSDYGGGRWEEVRCGTLVDLRFGGGFCGVHRRQGIGGSGSGGGAIGGKAGGNLTFMQKQRMESMGAFQNGGNVHSKNSKKMDSLRSSSSNVFVRPSAGGIGGRFGSSSLSDALAKSGLFASSGSSTVSNSNSNTFANKGMMTMAMPGGNVVTYNPTNSTNHANPAGQSSALKRAPLHMKKTTNSNVMSSNSNGRTGAGSSLNPYAKQSRQTMQSNQSKQPLKQNKSNHSNPLKRSNDLLGEALNRKRSRSDTQSFSIKEKSLISSTQNNPTNKLASKYSKHSNKRPCKVFHTEGYDGAVQVPKPNSILFKNGTPSNAVQVTPPPNNGHHGHCQGLSEEAERDILERQKSLAELLNSRKDMGDISGGRNGGNGRSLNSSVAHSKNVTNATASGRPGSFAKREVGNKMKQSADPFASFFGGATEESNNSTNPTNSTNAKDQSSSSFDREAILNAKSRFASASNAEEYARARSMVQELEMKELEDERKKERMERMKEGGGGNSRKNTDKRNDGKTSIVTTGWACRTCKKKTTMKPMGCIRSRHDVRQQRGLKEGASLLGTRKERLERHGKEVEMGGLTLGSGLEWSGWRGELG